jgi:hypothetical protein
VLCFKDFFSKVHSQLEPPARGAVAHYGPKILVPFKIRPVTLDLFELVLFNYIVRSGKTRDAQGAVLTSKQAKLVRKYSIGKLDTQINRKLLPSGHQF